MRPTTDRRLFRAAVGRAAAAGYECWMLFPAWLLANRLELPAVLHGQWLVAAVVLSMLCAAGSQWWHVRWQKVLASVVIAGGAVWLGGGGGWAIGGGVLLWLAMIQGFTVVYRYRHITWIWAGVLISFIASIAVHAAPVWHQLTGPVLVGGIVNLAAALFQWNHQHLKAVALADDDSRRIPAELMRHNRLYLTVILVCVLALAAGVGGWLTGILTDIFGIIGKLLRMLFGSHTSQPLPEPTPGPLPTPLPIPDQPSEPSLFSKILDFSAKLLAFTVIAALVCWALWALYRNRRVIWRTIARLLSFLLRSRGQTRPDGTGFVDEETSLFSFEETMARFRQNRLGRWLSGKREPRFEDMPDNREKTRFLYRRWLRSQADRGYRVQAALTPEETARDVGEWTNKRADSKAASPLTPEGQKALIELYYLARYRNEQPSDEQLNDIVRNQGAR